MVWLAEPRDAFRMVTELLAEGGLGRIHPFWTGPSSIDTTVLPANRDLADPDGSTSGSLFSLLGSRLGETA